MDVSNNDSTLSSNEVVIKEISEALTDEVKDVVDNVIDTIGDKIEKKTGIDEQLVKQKLNVKRDSLLELVEPTITLIVDKLPLNKEGKTLMSLSNIWDILKITMEMVEVVKKEKKFPGPEAKYLVLKILRILIERYVDGGAENDACIDLLGKTIPAAIDLIVSAANGEINVKREILDVNNDGKIDIEDVNVCCGLIRKK